jgi:hypothetical protein
VHHEDVLHDQDRKQKPENKMAMKYQKGTVYPSGKRVYVQVVEENVMRAVNSHATTVLDGWTPRVESMGRTGRNLRRLPEPTEGTEAI